MIEELERKANKELLKYACMRQIFCACGRILDIRDAVLVTGERSAISCGPCFRKIRDAFIARHGEKAKLAMGDLDIIDGASLNS